MKYMPGDYVDISTGETINSLVFKRLKDTHEVKVIRKFKQKALNGNEERVYTTIEYEVRGKIWSGGLFDGENQVNVLDAQATK